MQARRGVERPQNRPRKRSAEETQQRILDAAEREFAVRGFGGARLREIAIAADIQPALIHHYFADKRGLHEAVVRRGLELMSHASWMVMRQDNDLAGYVGGFVDVLVDLCEEHHNLIAIFRGELVTESASVTRLAKENIAPLMGAVVALAESFQTQGAIRKDITAEELVLGSLSLILYPVIDAPLVRAVLPGLMAVVGSDQKKGRRRARRKWAIGQMILGSLRPAPTEPRAVG